MARGLKKGQCNNLNGRPKGVPNKITMDIKEMIRAALDDAGGKDYLLKQAEENPTAFLTLVSKIIPASLKVSGDPENPLLMVHSTEIRHKAVELLEKAYERAKIIDAKVIETTRTVN